MSCIDTEQGKKKRSNSISQCGTYLGLYMIRLEVTWVYFIFLVGWNDAG